MNVIFTCGGTAGHVNPALALARYMQEKDPRYEGTVRGHPQRHGAGPCGKGGL